MTTAIIKPTEKKQDIRSYISSDKVKAEIARVIPKHLTADIMARVVCTAMLKTPKLMECNLPSLLQSIMLLSQFGLLPDGRSAHLIPYFSTKDNCYVCQAIIDWKGKVARATENGVENIAAEIVCMNDKFTWKQTMDGLKFEHEPDWRNPDRGEMFAAYCIWKHGGKFSGVIMTKTEIDAIRKRSKSPDKGPWVTDFAEMSKKSAVHRASKLWPLDAKFEETKKQMGIAEATIDVESLAPMDNALDAPPAQDESPAASLPQAEKEKPADSQPETAKQFLARMMDENGITYDEVAAFCNATNVCQNADEFASIEDMPIAVVEVLVTPVKMSKILKTYRKDKKV